jgi:excisionase family DNA binding protein
MTNSDEIMTLEQVARYLKLKPQTVYKWAQEGRIPAAKLGKEWRFRKRILDEWIDSAIMQSKTGAEMERTRREKEPQSDPPDEPSETGASIETLDPRMHPGR